MLSVVCAVDWSSALAASAQQAPGTVGTPYQHITSLLSLRNFTTEQRGTTVLCVRKHDKVMHPIVERVCRPAATQHFPHAGGYHG
jgi:hypothetical protein